ncbi:PTS sugar transporter subunit IIA [Oceanobacillus alkalisoli]|uniref:PTS sugar transporter subunit IIA n=1 Tax=Oceanobacillus alkalisoli TaxID=2925113 RepID=UPI001EE4865E|nr:PTS sugar transporter subunit IIA [Oceanobacillus alkalisoli]MCG5104753.1 PTS sugar transporter subunit IIA [Oceanobacillus alkalisoli]
MTKMFYNAKLDADSYMDLINKLGKQMFEAGYVKKTYIDAVLEREKAMPTGLRTGHINVAIPHTDVTHVNESAVVVATLEHPVNFNLMDNPDQQAEVDIVFLLAVNDPSEQPVLLSRLMSLIKEKEILNKIKKANDNQALEEILSLKME